MEEAGLSRGAAGMAVNRGDGSLNLITEKTMTKILIEPMKTKTRAGWDAEINGVSDGKDCLGGWIQTPAIGKQEVWWDDSGICRNGISDADLDPAATEVAEVLLTVDALFP